MATDTSTTLNPGAGGDALDESSVLQQDGTTAVKRARVDTGFAAEEGGGPIVSRNRPLPVELRYEQEMLEQMAGDIRELKDALLMFLSA